MSETRKLAAILVADVVGYGRLAGADEDRSARISILAGRSPPKPDTLQQTDHRPSRKIPCRRGGPYVFDVPMNLTT